MDFPESDQLDGRYGASTLHRPAWSPPYPSDRQYKWKCERSPAMQPTALLPRSGAKDLKKHSLYPHNEDADLAWRY